MVIFYIWFKLVELCFVCHKNLFKNLSKLFYIFDGFILNFRPVVFNSGGKYIDKIFVFVTSFNEYLVKELAKILVLRGENVIKCSNFFFLFDSRFHGRRLISPNKSLSNWNVITFSIL